MFSVYMHEVNFKMFIIFNLFYLLFCFGPDMMCAQEISASRFTELCLGVVVSEHNLTSHTSHTFSKLQQ
jgi:hypothetical protein